MKYCAKCGTQMSDDVAVCPQCHPEKNKLEPQLSIQSPPTKSITSKIIPFILTNVIISILTLIAIIGMYFILPSNNNSENSNNWNSTCPADEYGYHDWSTAKCTEPAHCYECGAYRDDKLGEHMFETDDDGLRSCWHCGMLYEVYIDSLN